MTSKQDISQFLSEFKTKLVIWDLIFRSDRGKNATTLLALELTLPKLKEILKELREEDFSEGPLTDTFYKGARMWVFGKDIKKKEVYIKVTLGELGKQVICISFHFAEHPMRYPFKKRT